MSVMVTYTVVVANPVVGALQSLLERQRWHRPGWSVAEDDHAR